MGKNFIDLFCGAGGLSLGFERAGYKCVGAIDVSKACVDTHKLNFPDCVSINSDISKIKPNKFKEKIGNKKIHLINTILFISLFNLTNNLVYFFF